MGWFSFLKSSAASVPTPSTGKVAIFVDSTSGVPHYKGEDGVAHTLKGDKGDPGSGGFANPMTTPGDLIVGGVAGVAGRLGAGTAGYVLTSAGPGVAPSWSASSGGGSGTFIDPTTTDFDIIMRKVEVVDAVGIGFIGDSITAGTVVTTAPPGVAAADLSDGGLTVTATNQGVSGATSAMWVGGSGYMTSALSFFAAATPRPRIVHIMLGTNDSKTGVATSADDYKANLLSAANALITAGYLVAVSYPPYLNTTSGVFDAASPGRVESYLAVIDSIVDNNHIFQGDTAGYAYFEANTSALQSDGVHPTQDGSDHLAGLWATALLPLVNSVGNTVALQRAVFGSDFEVVEVDGVLTIIASGSSATGILVNRQTGTSYTADSTDNGKAIEMSNASANTVTFPPGLPDGFNCLVTQAGTGQTSVAAGSGAMLRNPNPTAKTRAQWASLTVRRTNTASEYALDGNAAAT